MSRDPATQARTILVDATTIATVIDAALHNLEASMGGYPSTTPGAGPADTTAGECHDPGCTETEPCPWHNPPGIDTPVERMAGHRDNASFDRGKIIRLTSRVARDIATLATMCSQWGLGGIDQSTVKARLNDALSGIWCTNCAGLGHNNRRTHGEYCEFCAGIKSKYKRYPNGALLAIHATGRRILPSDVKRCFEAPKVPLVQPIPSLDEARRRRDKRVGEAS